MGARLFRGIMAEIIPIGLALDTFFRE